MLPTLCESTFVERGANVRAFGLQALRLRREQEHAMATLNQLVSNRADGVGLATALGLLAPQTVEFHGVALVELARFRLLAVFMFAKMGLRFGPLGGVVPSPVSGVQFVCRVLACWQYADSAMEPPGAGVRSGR